MATKDVKGKAMPCILRPGQVMIVVTAFAGGGLEYWSGYSISGKEGEGSRRMGTEQRGAEWGSRPRRSSQKII